MEGGHETYRGRVRGLAGFDRIFAVKCLRRRSGPPLSRTDPFVVAAKRLSTITEPRVPRVLDADVVDGVAIAVTEFVHGLDLDRFREWAQVSGELATGAEDTAVRWQKLVAYLGTEVAGALTAMHALVPPLVHGALSPRNVIATTRGGIKLLDFGLAVAAQKSGEPLPQRALAYAAPSSSDPEPSAAADVRALGAMLFELATGELPPPDVSQASARQILEPLWPAMAELIASMLAEDPLSRPRASKVAEAMASHWSDTSEASMVTEMASLVRNFSAFVTDSPHGGTPGSVTPEPVVAKAAPVTATLLSVPPPPSLEAASKARSSGSFFAASDERTRVNPDEGYASAMFKALPPDVALPGAMRPGSTGGELAGKALEPAPASPPAAAKPIERRPVPGMRNAAPPVTARTLVMSPAPAVPPQMAPPLPRQAVAMPPLPSAPSLAGKPSPVVPPPGPRPPAAMLPLSPLSSASKVAEAPSATKPASPPLPALKSPAVPPSSAAKPPSLAPTLPAMPAPSAPAARPPSVASAKLPPLAPADPPAVAMPMLRPSDVVAVPSTVAESADWGAQALVALGTQAGIPISLVGPGTGAAPSPLAAVAPTDEPPVQDPFAAASVLAPQDSWLSPQPASQGAKMAPIEAPLGEPEAPVELAPAAPAELLDDERMENDQTPVFVPLGGGEQDMAEPALEPVLASAEVSQAREPALEATAFEAAEEPEAPPVELRMAESMTASEEPSSSEYSEDPGLEQPVELAGDESEEAWQPPRSRKKKILLITAISVVLGAGAAVLVLHFSATKPSAPLPTLQKTVAKKPTGPALAPVKPAAATAKTAAPVGKAGTTEQAAPVAKVPTDKAAAEKSATKALPTPSGTKVALAEKTAGKAEPPAPAEKTAVAEKPTGKVAALAPATKSALPEVPPSAPAKVTAVLPTPAAKTKEASEAKLAPTAPLAGGAVRVRMNSQPDGAMVWVNGEERGKTPLTVDLRPGSAQVVLVRPGYLTSQKTLDVREGAKLDETLQPVEAPMKGDARFRAECKTEGKLPIVVDGKETGVLCPFSKLRVEPGTHTIGLLVPATGKVHNKEIILFAGVRSVVFQD